MAQDNPNIQTARLVVRNADGLYSRAAAKLIRLGQAYDAQLSFTCGEQRVQAKSIMSLLSLDADQGAVLTATAEGPDAALLIRAVEELFTNGFRDPPDSIQRTAAPGRKAGRPVREEKP